MPDFHRLSEHIAQTALADNHSAASKEAAEQKGRHVVRIGETIDGNPQRSDRSFQWAGLSKGCVGDAQLAAVS